MAENRLFEEARDAFLNSLAPRERQQFDRRRFGSAKDVILDLRNHDALKKKQSLVRKSIDSVEKLGDSLAPFFGAIGFFAQAHAETAGIFWGSIRLIIQLACNYNSFFRKLTITLDQLATELALFNGIADSFPEKALPPRLKKALCAVYTDLLRFCQTVVGVFSRQDGASKRGFALFADIVWKNYDMRFKDLLESLRINGALVKDEVQLATYNMSKETHSKAVEYYKIINSELLEMRKQLNKIEEDRVLDYEEQLEKAKKESEWTQKAMERSQREARESALALGKLQASLESRPANVRPKLDILNDIRRWLDPPKFALEFERAVGKREPETAEWLFHDSRFLEWNQGDRPEDTEFKLPLQERCLWIRGNPGAGKTILAASVVEELKLQRPKQNTSYFFFRQGIPVFTCPLSAYRSILAQTLKRYENEESEEKDDGLINKLIFAMTDAHSGQLQATKDELIDTLRLCAETNRVHYLVLDGIDECDDSNEFLKDLSGALHETSTKVIFFSRPHIALPLAIRNITRVDIGKSPVKDIQTYLARRLDDMIQENSLPANTEITEIVEPLLSGADGMFLWAYLMIKYLQSPSLTPKKRLREIQSIVSPEGLDIMYERILHHLTLQLRRDLEFASWVFMWIAFAYEPITATALQATFSVLAPLDDDNDDGFTDFNASVLACTASLVEPCRIFRNNADKSVPGYRFIHLSVLEFIARQSESPEKPSRSLRTEPHLNIARASLQYIALNIPRSLQMCPGSTQGGTLQVSVLDHNLPLLAYATTHWARHLQAHMHSYRNATHSAQGPVSGNIPVMTDHSCIVQHTDRISRPPKVVVEKIMASMSTIANNHSVLMRYIEASYTFHTIGVGRLREWFEWTMLVYYEGALESQPVKTAEKMIHYLLSLHAQWGSQLEHRPWLIWDEVPAFAPSTLLPQPAGIRLHSLQTTDPHFHKDTSKHLVKISKTSTDGEYIGALSVWPSRSYIDLADGNVSPDCFLHHLRKASQGWYALYEVWSNDTTLSKRVSEKIVLGEEMIWAQFVRSLTLADSLRKLRLQFPIHLSPCLRKFAILDRIFFVRVGSNEARILPLTRLPFSLDDIEGTWWGEELKHPCSASQETLTFDTWRKQNCLLSYRLDFDSSFSRVVVTAYVLPVHGSVLSLVVLGIGNAEKPSVHFEGSLKTLRIKEHTCWHPEKHHRPIFHPTQSLLMFTAPQTPWVWACLWAYRGQATEIISEAGQPSVLAVREEEISSRGSDPNIFPISSSNPDAKLWYVPGFLLDMKELNGGASFSDDGKHLVMTQAGQRKVVRIPELIFKTCGAYEGIDSPPGPDIYAGSSQSIVSRLLAGQEVALRGPSIVTSTSNQSLTLSFQNPKSNKKWIPSVEISALPEALTDMKDLSSTMHAPKTPGDKIRVILNQEPDPSSWYESTKVNNSAVGLSLPMVIDRDGELIRHGWLNSDGSTELPDLDNFEHDEDYGKVKGKLLGMEEEEEPEERSAKRIRTHD